MVASSARDSEAVPRLLRRREQFGDNASFGAALGADLASKSTQIENLLKQIDHPYAKSLLAELGSRKASTADLTFLTSVGRIWPVEEPGELLIEPAPWAEHLRTAESALLQDPPRSLLVSGEPQVGKTSLLRLIGRKLQERGWTIFEASGAGLMAGQIYFGQLEGRVAQLVQELSASKRVAWYIADFVQLATSGTHQGQAASILDQIFAALTSGRLIVLGEATPNGFTRLQQVRPALRSALELIRMRPLTEPETATLAQMFAARVQKELGLTCESNTVPTALYLARQYLGASQLPGSVIDLIKLSANRAVANSEPALTPDGLLTTLSQTTGLPKAILDEKERIDLDAIRSFFTERIIGQEEAVGAIVDRIAMLKAGLTDTARPIAVFLFAGPTGTGKTELAKTLAAYLFGSAERMIRLDMSEFQTAEFNSQDPGRGGRGQRFGFAHSTGAQAAVFGNSAR